MKQCTVLNHEMFEEPFYSLNFWLSDADGQTMVSAQFIENMGLKDAVMAKIESKAEYQYLSLVKSDIAYNNVKILEIVWG